MKINKLEIEQRMEHFQEVCRNAGMKLTHQRMEIFREVAQTEDHPDVLKVYQGVLKRIPTISLDTVYRTLWMLKDLGLITTRGESQERTRFDANLNNHHHFVCVRCRQMRDFYSNEFDELRLPDFVKAFGQIETTQVEVKGVCLNCAAKIKKAKH